MRKYTKKQIEEAVKGSGGIISVIARKLGCSWETAKKNIDKFEECLLQIKEERETVTDMAETTIINSIQSGDVQTAKWYLSTIGRDRGYGDKLDVSANVSLPTEIIFKKSE